MILGPGGVLQRGPKTLGRVHPELGAGTVHEFDRRLRLPLTDDPGHTAHADEGLHDRPGIAGADQYIDVPDGVPPPPQASGELGALDALDAAQQREQLTGDGQRVAQRRAIGSARERRDALEHLRLRTLAHTRQVAQLPFLRRGLETGEVHDAQ